MKISTILDHIDSGRVARPEFQRGYVWNRSQVRGLFDSLYRRHPVGSLLVWVTESKGARSRGNAELAPGVVNLLLDGQQRITSLYGLVRGRPPEFFDGNKETFTGLHFHLDSEEFSFYQPVKMKDDPFWIDVTNLVQEGVGSYFELFADQSVTPEKQKIFFNRLNAIHAIPEIDLHTEEVTGADKTIDMVVDIFNRVNSGGTKLSKGDLAMAKICADWPEARDRMKSTLARWHDGGYSFDLDWFLRNMNTIVTGEAKFSYLHGVDAIPPRVGGERAERHVDYLLNLISGRLGLDHDRVLFGRYSFPVMTHYLDRRGGQIADEVERDKLLFWYLNSAMWGRFSGSTESIIDKDLKALEETEGGLDRLISELRLWHGNLQVVPDHFGGWSLGARFYPVLYLITRTRQAKDWRTGVELQLEHLGKMQRPEVHHIFPKAQLYKAGYTRPLVNAVANYCFQSKETNLWISDRLPEDYFREVRENLPGALESQWIPMDEDIWKVENYLDFLEARKKLLADAVNEFLEELYHGSLPDIETPTAEAGEVAAPREITHPEVPGGIDSEEEEAEIRTLNEWVTAIGLPKGDMLYELMHPQSEVPLAVLDLAWPNGMQVGLSEPVAVLLNEGDELLRIASQQGFKCFTEVEAFKNYVEHYILSLANHIAAAS